MTAATAFEKTILRGLRRMRGKAPVAIESTDTVNDIHLQLNETQVATVRRPRSFEDVRQIVRQVGLPRTSTAAA